MKRYAIESFKINGRTYNRGDIISPEHENDPAAIKKSTMSGSHSSEEPIKSLNQEDEITQGVDISSGGIDFDSLSADELKQIAKSEDGISARMGVEKIRSYLKEKYKTKEEELDNEGDDIDEDVDLPEPEISN